MGPYWQDSGLVFTSTLSPPRWNLETWLGPLDEV